MKHPETRPNYYQKAEKLLPWAFVLITWLFIARFDLTNDLFLPDPSEVLKAGVTLLGEGEFWKSNFETIERLILALSIGTSAGVPIGALIGTYKKINNLTENLIEFMRAIPVTALLTYFMLIFGIGNASKVAMVSWFTTFNILIGTYEGIKNVDQDLLDAAHLDGASEWQVLSQVTLPLSLNYILANFRVTAANAFALTLVSEMVLGGGKGLGKELINSFEIYNTPKSISLLLWMGLLGMLLNKSTAKLARLYSRRELDE